MNVFQTDVDLLNHCKKIFIHDDNSTQLKIQYELVITRITVCGHGAVFTCVTTAAPRARY